MQTPLAEPHAGPVPHQQFDAVTALVAEQIGITRPGVDLQDLLNIERQPVSPATQIHRHDHQP
jgi:hypothetical protein